MNQYFQNDIKLKPGTKARAEDVNARFDAIVDGFDKLPAPHSSLPGFADPVAVGTPTDSAHAVSTGTALGGGLSYAVDIGAANAYVANLAIAPTAYRDGLTITFKAANANTGASTINVNGLGIKQLCRSNGSPLAAGDIAAGQIISVVYNGTKFLGTAAFAGQFNDVINSTKPFADAAALSAAQAAASATEAGTAKVGAETAKAGADAAKTGADTAKAGSQTAEANATAKANAAEQSYQNTLGIFGSAQAVQNALNTSSANAAATGADKLATAADRVQTGQDRTQTGLDRVQTSLDRDAAAGSVLDASAAAADAAASAVTANTQAGIAATKAGEAAGSATAAAGSATAAAQSATDAGILGTNKWNLRACAGLSALTLDCSLYDTFWLQGMDRAIALTLSNMVPGKTITIFHYLGVYNLTFPGLTVWWPGGTAPAWSGNTDCLVLTMINSGLLVGGYTLDCR